MTQNAIKLVSVNIEMNRHLDSVSSFLEKEKSDIICFQELLEKDVAYFETLLKMPCNFVPIGRIEYPSFEPELKGSLFGLGLLCRFPARYKADYYAGSAAELPLCATGYEGNKLLLQATFSAHGKTFTVGTTHFTWTPDGEASDAQREDLCKLLAILSGFPDIVCCGDFNAPRGGEIWGELAKRYNDNIPAAYRSSLDPVLHRAGHLEHVVDGLFNTPEYRVSGVRLVEGVSDHKAIVGTITRV